MGCVKTVCSSSSGNNGAFVNDIRLGICKNQFKEARNSFFGLGVYLLKSKFRIEDKLRFP